MANRKNLITDITGLKVGNAHDPVALTGVTVLLPEKPTVAAVDVRGGGPGTRETDALGPTGTVQEIHGVVLSGGSAFGLLAASAVQTFLAQRKIGFEIGNAIVPIVPQAILFDLLNGGDKSTITNSTNRPLYERLAAEACQSAAPNFNIGSNGAGFGATTATWRGGLGSASSKLSDGLEVGALVAVNAVGSATIGNSKHFWAYPFEQINEFGNAGPPPAKLLKSMTTPKLKGGPAQSTTIAVVATNAKLTRPLAQRLAIMAQTGLARALHPVHTPLDGDVVFAIATCTQDLDDPHLALSRLGSAAADCLSRAVARGIYEAETPPPGWTGPPAYRDGFGDSV